MPLYDYACKRGHVVTQLRAMKDRHNEEPCATCGSPLQLTIAAPGFRRDHTVIDEAWRRAQSQAKAYEGA